MLKLIVFFYYTLDHQIKCGDAIRLEHALTKKNLHSEEIYQSMVSGGQEISAYGTEGEGNDSKTLFIQDDNWVLRCVHKSEGEQFFGGDVI